MTRAFARTGILCLIVSLLHACGGGGNGDGDGSGSGSGPHLTLGSQNISVSATPGEETPVGSVTLTVSDPPAAGVFVEGEFSASGIEWVEVVPTSSTQATLNVYFRSPGSLLNDTYADSITLRVCTDQQCTNQVRGSPATIRTSYVVSGTGVASVSLDRPTVEITADTREQSPRTEVARLTLSTAPASGVHVLFDSSTNGVEHVATLQATDLTTEVNIVYKPGSVLGSGTFNDTVNLTVCYDPTCVRQVAGSPLIVSSTLTVGVGAEPGFAPLEVASRVALSHDVIDAEFSKALNRLVMVSNYPVNALYVYDVATGVESQQLLSKIPTSVSISPDGLTAAVGHDALISVVDLNTVDQAGAPAPITLSASADVFDLVLDGNGHVHALARVDQWTNVHSVEIATNTEMLSGGTLYAGAHGRLHPSGTFMYTANNGLSPSDIEKWDVSSGVATYLYDSPYHGDYEMCGNLWFNESGNTIYTRCGNTFRSSTVESQDMVYSGALELSPSDFYGWLVRHLSQSDAHGEVAIVEYEWYHCEIAPSSGPCYTHLALYEDDFLNRLAVYSIGPVEVNDQDYAQHGLFVFHDAVGTNKYLLSRLEGTPNPDAEYYLSVIP